MPRVLITGVAGFIGMHTALKYLNMGWRVTGLDNLNSYYDVGLKHARLKNIEGLKSSGVFEFVLEDLNSEVWSSLREVKFDVVIHLAAQAGVRYSLSNPDAYIQSNILGFQKVLDFVHQNEVKAFLYASSSSVYGKKARPPFSESNEPCDSPESYYAATKKANELMAYSYAQTHKVSSIGLRFFTVYGPWGRPDMAPYLFTKAAFSNEIIKVFNHGKQSRDFTYIDDIVEGIFRCAQLASTSAGASCFNIGCGKPVRLMDFIREIERATGNELKKDFVEAQPGDVEQTFADVEKLQTAIDFRAKTELPEGIRRFVSWYREYNSLP